MFHGIYTQHTTNNGNIRKYTATRMSVPMQLQCVKRVTEYPLLEAITMCLIWRVV